MATTVRRCWTTPMPIIAAALAVGALVVPTVPAYAQPATCNGRPVTISGTAGNDTITGTGAADVIAAGAGNDTVFGLGGNDTVCPGPGNDVVNGGLDNDTVVAESVVDGADTFSGGPGRDTADYTARTVALTIRLDGVANDGTPGEGDNHISVESVNGGAGGDTLDGSSANLSPNLGGVILVGGAGGDTLTGTGTGDFLVGGDGVDTLVGNNGPDVLFGNANLDLLFGGAGADILLGDEGDDRMSGGADNDTLDGMEGNDTLAGNQGNDTLLGGENDDTAVADSTLDGADRFSGGTGRDTVDYALRTGALNVSPDGVANDGAPGEGDNNEASVENVIGGRGNDTIRGNSESNRLFGGPGNDNLNSVDNNFGNDRIDGGPNFDVCISDNVDLRIDCEV